MPNNYSYRVNPITNQLDLVDSGSVLQSSAFNTFSSSYYNDSSSFNQRFEFISAGAVSLPGYIDKGDGTLYVSESYVRIYNNSGFSSSLIEYYISPITASFVNDITNYVIADYNNGLPIYNVIQNVELITESDVIPIFTVYKDDDELYIVGWDQMAVGLPNKLHQRVVKTQRFEREDGLIMSELATPVTGTLVITSGRCWNGVNRTTIPPYNSSTNVLYSWHHSSSVWIESSGSYYDNTHFDNGTELLELSGSYYSTLWVYKFKAENSNEAGYVWSTGQFSDTTTALASTLPSDVPAKLVNIGILIGRIIVQKGASTGLIQSAFSTTFAQSSTIDHNSTSNLNTGDYQHLTEQQFITTLNISSSYFNDSSSFNTKINNITESFNNFTSSYEIDSGSFLNLINQKLDTSSYLQDSSSFDTKINNTYLSQSNYLLTSSFNIFSQSYYNDSTSFDNRLDNIEITRIPVSDSDYSVTGSNDQLISYTSISAKRIVTLPSSTREGQFIYILDESGSVNITNRIKVLPSGSDTINGKSYKLQINPRTHVKYLSNGLGDWNATTTFDRLSTGIILSPTYEDNLSGSVIVGNDGVYNLNSKTDGSAPISSYEITGSTFLLTDLTTNYVIADYNDGTPIIRVTTDVTIINETTIIPVFTVYREGTRLHLLPWNNLGLALVNKLHQSIIKTQRYRLQSGLMLGETPTRIVTLTEGIVWVGANSYTLSEFNSSANSLYFLYQIGGAWQTSSLVTTYNNTQYNDNTGLHSLNPNKYAVNYIYRGVEVENECYLVLGEGNYTLLEAQGSLPPANLPSLITSHAILVGRIIVQQSLDTSYQIDSIFAAAFALSTTANHNDLSGIQGGISTERYHLTAAESSSLSINSSSFDSRINNLIYQPLSRISSSYSMSLSDLAIECTTGNFTVNIPTSVGIKGKEFIIKNSGTGSIILDGYNNETIDGSVTFVLNTQDALFIISNGSNWLII
jgi:hypothetical protein